MNKTSNWIKTICEIGIFAAIGFVLDSLQGAIFKGVFINGGAIGFAMIAVLIIGFRRGFIPAIITGLIMGTLDVATSAYILNPAQLLLDYILPYAVVGLACLLRPLFINGVNRKQKIFWIIVITTVGGLLKFLSHFLAGVLFWGDPATFAWNIENVYLYCFLYNIAYIGPSIVLTAALLIAIYVKSPKIIEEKESLLNDEKEEKEKKDLYPVISSITLLVSGLAVFVIFLIKYILSYENTSGDGAIGYEFNPDSMVIFILGLFVAVLGATSLYKIKNNGYSRIFQTSVLVVDISIAFLFGLARMIRMLVKGKDATNYIVWVAVSAATLLAAIGLLVYFIRQRNKGKQNII